MYKKNPQSFWTLSSTVYNQATFCLTQIGGTVLMEFTLQHGTPTLHISSRLAIEHSSVLENSLRDDCVSQPLLFNLLVHIKEPVPN
jgi:hypothetical protein